MFRKKKKKYVEEIEAEDKPKTNPDWIEVIAQDKQAQKLEGDEKQMLKDLYMEYRFQGMPPLEALNKAKRTLACFGKGGEKV